MRTRQKTYSDYGISDAEVKRIKDFCHYANDEEKMIIKTALSELDPYIAPYVFFSLVDNLSYEDICARNYLYIGKGDFYGLSMALCQSTREILFFDTDTYMKTEELNGIRISIDSLVR